MQFHVDGLDFLNEVFTFRGKGNKIAYQPDGLSLLLNLTLN